MLVLQLLKEPVNYAKGSTSS